MYVCVCVLGLIWLICVFMFSHACFSYVFDCIYVDDSVAVDAVVLLVLRIMMLLLMLNSYCY